MPDETHLNQQQTSGQQFGVVSGDMHIYQAVAKSELTLAANETALCNPYKALNVFTSDGEHFFLPTPQPTSTRMPLPTITLSE